MKVDLDFSFMMFKILEFKQKSTISQRFKYIIAILAWLNVQVKYKPAGRGTSKSIFPSRLTNGQVLPMVVRSS